MVELRFLPQPDGNGGSLADALAALLNDPKIDSFTAVVAWVRFRGLARLAKNLEIFNARGHSRIILGVDERGATKPGLYGALRHFSEAYVYHVADAGTFHPKLYLASGPTKACLLVGSSNLTPGGLFYNDEVSLEAEFPLPRDRAQPALVGATAHIDRLLADVSACRPLSEELIKRMIANKRYQVSATERRRSGSAADDLPKGAEPDDVDENATASSSAINDEPLFGKSNRKRARVPKLSADAKDELAELEGGTSTTSTGGRRGGRATSGPSGSTRRRTASASRSGQTVTAAVWRKTLDASGAQQNAGHKTSVVRLTQERKWNGPIPFLTYFRRNFFKGQTWRNDRDRRNNPIQVATVPFDVAIMGTSYGVVNLEVDHARHRESKQRNHATVLHWGDVLNPVMRANDYTDKLLTLARLSDGTYRLTIS